jgi:hypothetical protein
MLAGPRHHPDNLGPLVRGCGKDDPLHAGIRRNLLQAVKYRIAAAFSDTLSFRPAAVEHTRNINAQSPIRQGFKMWFGRHAEADQGKAHRPLSIHCRHLPFWQTY